MLRVDGIDGAQLLQAKALVQVAVREGRVRPPGLVGAGPL
jgi:hypothetical protein